jgi:hypothetical protein
MPLHRTLIATSIAACLLAACDRSATQPTAQAAAPTAAPASINDVELIPRDALFGNPERTDVQISPDGKYLSWLAAVDGVINVWIAPADDLANARAVTADTARGIQRYF